MAGCTGVRCSQLFNCLLGLSPDFLTANLADGSSASIHQRFISLYYVFLIKRVRKTHAFAVLPSGSAVQELHRPGAALCRPLLPLPARWAGRGSPRDRAAPARRERPGATMAAAVLGRAALCSALRGARQRQALLRRGFAGLAVDDTVNGLSDEQRQVGAVPAANPRAARGPGAAARLPAGEGGGVSALEGADWLRLRGAGQSAGVRC